MLTDIKMALRNIWRSPVRTILTLSAIAFASIILVFMFSFQLGSYEAMINSSVKIHTGHLQVQAKEYNEKKNMRLAITSPGKITEKNRQNIADQGIFISCQWVFSCLFK